MDISKIIQKLPYTNPFLFVDEILTVSEEKIEGNYTFKENEFFYQGHFKDFPVTPGVILTECMAQIGLVCLGIYLSKETSDTAQVALSESNIEFLKPVFPKECVTVISEKIYFRFGKLKCRVKMLNEQNELICKGTISGILIDSTK